MKINKSSLVIFTGIFALCMTAFVLLSEGNNWMIVGAAILGLISVIFAPPVVVRNVKKFLGSINGKPTKIQEYILEEYSSRISRQNSQIILGNKTRISWLVSSTFLQDAKRSFTDQHPNLDVTLLDSVSNSELFLVLECNEHTAYFELDRTLAQKAEFSGKVIKLEDGTEMDCTLSLPMKTTED